MKKRIALILIAAVLACALCGCGGDAQNSGEPEQLSFKASTEFSAIQKLNGKKVSIIGYMATLSPVSGKYIYLMNLPYQSCPFCVPNTTQLANTMAVYAKDGKTFDYTDQAVRVTGTMQLGNTTDDYGYEYTYRIVDAVCEPIDLGTVSEDYALWVSIAEDGLVADLNRMLDGVYFCCNWPEYQMTYTDENGTEQTVWMYPGDTEDFLENEGPYGYAWCVADGYFEGMIERIRAISPTALEDVVQIVLDAQELQQYALEQLRTGAYTYDEGADQFKLNEYEELGSRFSELNLQYNNWICKWEV